MGAFQRGLPLNDIARSELPKEIAVLGAGIEIGAPQPGTLTNSVFQLAAGRCAPMPAVNRAGFAPDPCCRTPATLSGHEGLHRKIRAYPVDAQKHCAPQNW